MRYFLVALMFFIGVAAEAQTTVSVATYGAVGNLQTNLNVSTVNGSASITCATASFNSGMVGWTACLVGAGTLQSTTNCDLFTYVTAVADSTHLTLSNICYNTSSTITMLIGTNDYAAFTNTIAYANAHTPCNVQIPNGQSGPYWILPPQVYNSNAPAASAQNTLYLSSGGLTFIGGGPQGSGPTIMGMGYWTTNGYSAGKGYRSDIFCLQTPMTNDLPLIFTNLVLDGGCGVGNIVNIGYPPNPGTGLGWDGTHHWLGVSGTAYVIDSVQMYGCTVQHWRGEMMEDTSDSKNLYFTARNDNFLDGNASCVNNFGHDIESCLFSNANQTEEFFQSYNTNVSIMANCTNEDMNITAIAINGAIATSANYIVENNLFTNFYGSGPCAVFTTPAANFYFISNQVSLPYGLYLGTAGYQSISGFCNSNIWIAYNTNLNSGGGGSFVNYVGSTNSQNDAVQYTYTFSNTISAGQYGYSGYNYQGCYSNFFFANLGGFISPGTSVTFANTGCIWPLNSTNNAQQAQQLYEVAATTNAINYKNASYFQMQNGTSTTIMYLDNTYPSAIPVGAQMLINNPLSATISIYPSTNITGTPYTLSTGQNLVAYWIPQYAMWSNAPYVPPVVGSITYVPW